jgi:DNA polymerase-3 subunit epsilon
MKKTLYFDTETTGIDTSKHSMIQFSAIVDYDGEEVDSIDVLFQPYDEAVLEEEAFKKTGITEDQLLSFMSHSEGFQTVKSFLDKHIDKYNKADKFYSAGYNVRFDLEFLSAFFKYNGEKYGLGPYFNWKLVDPFPLLHIMDWKGKIKLPNYKLETVCEHFNIPISNAHNALDDIRATKQLIKKLL